jgi:hypothetical protein
MATKKKKGTKKKSKELMSRANRAAPSEASNCEFFDLAQRPNEVRPLFASQEEAKRTAK